MSLLSDAKTTVAKFLVNMGRFDQIMNGDINTDVTIDNGNVPTIRKLFDSIFKKGSFTEALALGINRTDIPNYTIPVNSFRTKDGALWEKGNPFSSMSISDKSGQFWGINVSDGYAEAKWFKLSTDNNDLALALNRAISALNSKNGGVLRIDSGTQVFKSSAIFPKGYKPIIAKGSGAATVLTNDPSYSDIFIQIGDTNTPGGGSNVVLEDLQFYGQDRTNSRAIRLLNANGMVFNNVRFTNLLTAVNSSDSYAVVFNNLCQFERIYYACFYSDTAAHGFTWDGVRAYGCGLADDGTTVTGKVIRIEKYTNALTVQNCDIETFSTLLSFGEGAQSPSIINNYTEFNRGDIIEGAASINNAQVSGNLFQLGATWNVKQFKGGGFNNNTVDAMAITFDSTSENVRVYDNPVINGGSLAQTPYIAPALTNGWTQQANYARVGFRIGADGAVYLRGNLVNQAGITLGIGATTNSPFTLPLGYRPTSIVTFETAGSNGRCLVFVFPDGTVRITAVGGSGTAGDPYQLGLNGISFQPNN